MEILAKLLGMTVAIGIFVDFMSLVGIPYVNKATIGLENKKKL